MKKRSLDVGLLPSAIVSALLLVLVAAGVTAAASPVSLEVRPLLGGRFETGGWLALSVRLTNDGPPVSGNLLAGTSDGTARRPVELPAGARKQVTLYVRPQAFQRKIEVRFEQDSTVLAKAEAELQVLDTSNAAHVVIVGDGSGSLRAQLVSRGAGLPEPISLLPADLPERAEPLAGIEVIVWAADSTALDPAQIRSLERWVAAGGQLVVLGGPDWQARSKAFSDLLPGRGPACGRWRYGDRSWHLARGVSARRQADRSLRNGRKWSPRPCQSRRQGRSSRSWRRSAGAPDAWSISRSTSQPISSARGTERHPSGHASCRRISSRRSSAAASLRLTSSTR